MCELDQIELDHSYNSRVQATMLLIKWAQRESDQANLDNLIPVLELLAVDFPCH